MRKNILPRQWKKSLRAVRLLLHHRKGSEEGVQAKAPEQTKRLALERGGLRGGGGKRNATTRADTFA